MYHINSSIWLLLSKTAQYFYTTPTQKQQLQHGAPGRLFFFKSHHALLLTNHDFFLHCKNSQSNWLKPQRGCKYLARCLHNVASFIAGGYISLETHKLWNVRILCILIECGTVNGCGNSAAWRLIPLCAVSQPSPWASIKWQNGPILENNNNKNTSL